MNVSDRIRPNSEAAPWVIEQVKKLEAELAEARAEVERLRATVGDDFNCCGGSDETPPQHTQDCSAHPPRCVICGKCQSVAVVANTGAYEARCVACLLSLGAERQKAAMLAAINDDSYAHYDGAEVVGILKAVPLVTEGEQ